jgi:hypothetical protein
MAETLKDNQPEPEIECPEFDGDEDDDPLFDSTRDYVEQIDRYKDYQGKPTARRARTRTRSPTAPRRDIAETSTLELVDEPPAPRVLLRRGDDTPPPARPRFQRGN